VTLEEQLALQAKKGLMGLGFEEETAEEYGPWASLLAQFLPGVGEGVGIDNTVNAINDERYGDAAIEGGLTLLGAVPIVGDLAAAAIKGIRRAPVTPKRSRKKIADMTAEERDAHNAWQRQDRLERNKRNNPDHVPRGSPKRLLSPEEIEAQEAGRRARDAERKRAARKDPEKLERMREQSRRSHQNNIDERKLRQGEYRDANREKINQQKRDKYAEDPEFRIKAKAHAAQKHAALLERSPEWRSPEKIDEIYKSADEATQITGVPHEVDHVIPLQGNKVSGLHHQDNLLVVPRRENRAKYNRFEPGDLPPRAGVRKSRAYLKKIRAAKEKAKR
jgi:hypothetical protein